MILFHRPRGRELSDKIMLNEYRANGWSFPGVEMGGIGNRPLASMRLEMVMTDPESFHVPINKPCRLSVAVHSGCIRNVYRPSCVAMASKCG
jgi:hypothetical protein